MDTKVSWPTVLGIVVLGSLIVFALASIPMNHWLDHPSDTQTALHGSSSPADNRLADEVLVPADQNLEPFQFAPAQIAVGSSANGLKVKTEDALPADSFDIQAESFVQHQTDSTSDAFAARQIQADKLLEIAETLVFQTDPNQNEEAGKQTSTGIHSQLLADNPLAGITLAELGPADTASELPLTDSVKELSLANSDVISSDLKQPTLDETSLGEFAEQWLAGSKQLNRKSNNDSPNHQNSLDDLAAALPLDSPLSDANIDLKPREIHFDTTDNFAAADQSRVSNAPRQRIKAQTVAQRIDKQPIQTFEPSTEGPTQNNENRTTNIEDSLPGMIATPHRLLQELDNAKRSFPEIAQWAIGYKLAIGQLCSAPLQDQRARLNQLELLRQQLDSLIQKDDDYGRSNKYSALRQLCYSMDRRLDFWQATIPGNPILAERQRQLASRIQLIRSRRWNFSSVNITSQWSQYLMWPQLVRIVNDSQMPLEEKRQYAREILTRINSGRLDFQQEAVISQLLPLDLQRQLYFHADLKVEPTEVLSAVEAYEAKGDNLSAMRIMEGYRWLRLSENVADRQIVELIENHYRNANVRFTASREFINRWFVSQAWVNQTIASQEENHVGIGVMPFQIDLIPSESGFHFQLNPAGKDDGSSEGWKPAVKQPPHQQDDNNSVISVAFHSRSTGEATATEIGGRYQGIPFTDWISGRHPTGMTVGTKVIPIKHHVNSSSKLAVQLNEQLSQRLGQTEAAVANTVRGFQLAGLAPRVIENSSHVDAITARFRIADNTQLASNTARPNPTANALLSLQLHQTFVNNSLQRIEVAGKSFNWNSLGAHLATVLGMPQNALQHHLPQLSSDELHFSDEQAIEIKFKNRQIKLCLNLDNARLGRFETGPIYLTNSFDVALSGCNIVLIPDSQIGWQIKSQQSSPNQVAQIVNHLNQITGQRSIRITPREWQSDFLAKQLEVSQLELSDGWLSISVEARPNEGKIALTQTTEDSEPSKPARPNSRLIQAFLTDIEPTPTRNSPKPAAAPILRSVLE